MKKIFLKFLLILPMMLSSCGQFSNNQSDNTSQNSSFFKAKYTIEFDLNGGTSNSYQGTVSTDLFSKNILFYDCVKSGYNFRGWSYNGFKIFDENANQLRNFTLSNNMKFTAIFEQNVKLNISTNLSDAGRVKGSGIYDFNSSVALSVTLNDQYRFLGWYIEDELLSSNLEYMYQVNQSDVQIEARFAYRTFHLNISSSNTDCGLVSILKENEKENYSVSDSDDFDYTNKVRVAACSKSDARFLGWFDKEGKIISTDPNYEFKMPYHDFDLEAKWNYFKISYNLDGGTNSLYNPAFYTIEDSEIVLSNPLKRGYSFLGWKRNDEFVTSISSSEAVDIVLDAVWKMDTYSISYDLDGGINSSDNPVSYTTEMEVVFSDAKKDGYDFSGWYIGTEKVENIEKGTLIGNLVLQAKWSPKLNSLSVASDDPEKGTACILSGQGYTGETIILEATPVLGYAFKGWYEGTTMVSRDRTYTFTMNFGSKSLTAYFWSLQEEENYNLYNISIGKKPYHVFDTDTLTYGLYPQTHVSDTSLISALDALTTTESNGWYLYNGSYYAKLSASPHTYLHGPRLCRGPQTF